MALDQSRRIHLELMYRLILGQSSRIHLEFMYKYQPNLNRQSNLTTNNVGAATANREFTQNETPLSIEIHRIHTWLAIGQSRRILVVTQYRYQQCMTRRLDLTTTANREFTQIKNPLAIEIHRIHTWLALGQSRRILVVTQYRYQHSLYRW